MINYPIDKLPGKPSEWVGLAAAILASGTPDESYWLEQKSNLDWSKLDDRGKLARAVLGMANRDADRAAAFLDGSALVLVSDVEVIDPTDLENKLSAFLGEDGPRWSPQWVKVGDKDVLLIAVDPPRAGTAGYTLRAKFGDYRISQTFVRVGSKTELASEADMKRLAARMVPAKAKPTVPVDVDFEIDMPLSRFYFEEGGIDAFLEKREAALLAPLTAALEEERKAKEQEERSGFKLAPEVRALGLESVLAQTAKLGSLGGTTYEETRTPEMYRRGVASYIADARAAFPEALREVALNILPSPRFVVSNLSDRNVKKVAVTIRVEGMADAGDADDNDRLYFLGLLPEEPRRWGPYTVPMNLGVGYSADLARSIAFNPGMPGRRELRRGGSFEFLFDKVGLRAGDTRIPLESDLVVLIPRDRPDPVVVHWEATASNIHGKASGEFELPFDGEPVDLLERALRDKKKG